MKITDQQSGVINILLFPLIISSTLLVMTIGFAAWAYNSRQDYKKNVDEKIAAAIEINTKEVSDQKDNEFLEREKFPLVTYQAKPQLGSIQFNYPKTWSAYINESEDTAELIFNPASVISGNNIKDALEVIVQDMSYEEAINSYDSDVVQGKVTSKAFTLPRVDDTVGIRLDGEIAHEIQGSVIIMPLRDKSILIKNEVPSLVNDFNNIVLPSFEYNP